MSIRTLYAAWGPGDSPAHPDQSVTVVDLSPSSAGLSTEIERSVGELRDLGLFPSQKAYELIILATLVYSADTRISRDSESEDGWTREIRLVIPVEDPALWNAVSSVFVRALNFLTGDLWTLEFRALAAGPAGRITKREDNSTKLPDFSGVALFSGGMDSLIGAIDQLEAGVSPLLVSHAGDGSTSAAQRSCIKTLENEYRNAKIGVARMWLQPPGGLVGGIAGESTTRARSFLFIAAAALAGSGLARAFELRIPENGFIALNVPMDVNRLGALSTRTTHPFYLARWQEALDGLGFSARLNNPYWNMTKGEMAASCRNKDLLLKLLRSSMSCSSPTKGRWEKLPSQHCGYCLPCIIRRAAVEHAFGKGGDPTTYTLANLYGHPLDTHKSEGRQIRSMQVAVERVRSAPHLADILIHKPGPLGDVEDRLAGFASVYRRGLEEVGDLIGAVTTKPL